MAGEARHPFCLLFIGIGIVMSVVMVNSASVPLGDNEEAAAELIDTRACYATVTTKKGLNVRARPNSDSTKFGALKYGAKTMVYGSVYGENVDGNDMWYKIKYQSKNAYISARYSSKSCSRKTDQDQDKSPLSSANTENLSSSEAEVQAEEPLA